MPPILTKRLGYGGSAMIAGSTQVLITGGSMEQANTPSFIEMMDIEPTTNSRSRVLHADGTTAYTGSLSFDVSLNALSVITASTLLMRRYQFEVGIWDGENSWAMTDCYMTSLSLAGAPAGFITANLSFMSKSVRNDSPSGTPIYILDDYYGTGGSNTNQPGGYWWSGNDYVKEWTFTMNQAVEPVYLNEDVMTPRYLKVGLIDYTLDVTLYQEWNLTAIGIMTKTFTLVASAVSGSKSFMFNGVSELGTYGYSFTSAASATTGAGDSIISVT
jgi:hypothetical protein